MSYPSLRQRRRRRRRTLIILGVVVVLVAAAYGITRVESDEARRREYLDAAMDVVTGHESAATRFASLIVGLEELQRTTMVSTLDELDEEVADLAGRITELEEPDGELLRGHLFLQIAATRWRSGMASTRDGMVVLSESALDETGTALVTEGLTELRVGDSAYAGFLAEIVDVDTTLLGGPFPRVAFIPEENRELFDPVEVARRLFLTPALGMTTNVAIADVSLTPAPLGEREGLPLIPAGSGLDVVVAVANTGNVDVESILVQLSLLSSDGATFGDDRLVAELAPGEVTSLSFEDLPVVAGTIYELTARIEGVDDDETDDSTSFLFVMDDET